MKKTVTGCLWAGLLAATMFAWGQAPDLQNLDLVLRSVPDGPIAKVNGQNIPKEEFITLYQTELLAVTSRLGSKNVDDRLRMETALHSLRTLLQHEILYQEAVKRKLTVSEKELDEQWKEAMTRLEKSVEKAGDKDLSEEDILKKAGKTREESRAELRRSLLVRKMRDRIIAEKKITVSDADVAAFYEKNKEEFKQPERLHVEQIFVAARKGPRDPDDPKKKEQARQKIEQALKRVQAGESFAAVAKAMSDAPDASKGGDMGILPVTQLPPIYVKAAASMRPGDVSGILESEYGFHFIRLVEMVAASDADPEKASSFIRSLLMAQEGDKAVIEFCKPTFDAPGAVEVYLQLEKTIATTPGLEGLLLDKNQKEADPQQNSNRSASKPSDAATKPKSPAQKPVKR
ncbi:MAG TPA: peptidylprolyl isomerase [Candidatus Hydrogenedentes bacterium]|nr:peptidylprolyl isomerase [Candidatus Hydrogenedentota bacterium]HRT19003.1 peptidylprolyl isomerase [Candidatus Hydrogenedentota bacterium]HRT65641.1 peptidylprolyl isomerase [Candidatus Hydrogenedentota bacterium]